MKDKKFYAGKFYTLTRIKPKIDGLFSVATGQIQFDIFDIERQIEIKTGYQSNKCIFNGKSNYSLNMVVREVWGEEALEYLKLMI